MEYGTFTQTNMGISKDLGPFWERVPGIRMRVYSGSLFRARPPRVCREPGLMLQGLCIGLPALSLV